MTSNGAPAGSAEPAEIDTSKAHAARVYDYLLGGRANFKVDREAAAITYAAWPGGIDAVRADVHEHRAALGRVVRYFARDGVTQFLDIGTGIPKQNNVHEVMAETFNRLNSRMAETVTLRSHDEVAALLSGLELVEPGVVQASQWRPDPGTTPASSQVWLGVGRKAV